MANFPLLFFVCCLVSHGMLCVALVTIKCKSTECFQKLTTRVLDNAQTTVKYIIGQFDLYQLKGELANDAAVQVARVNRGSVEEVRQSDDDSQSRLDVRLRGQNRVLRTPARTEAIAVLAASGVKQRLQHM